MQISKKITPKKQDKKYLILKEYKDKKKSKPLTLEERVERIEKLLNIYEGEVQ